MLWLLGAGFAGWPGGGSPNPLWAQSDPRPAHARSKRLGSLASAGSPMAAVCGIVSIFNPRVGGSTSSDTPNRRALPARLLAIAAARCFVAVIVVAAAAEA